MGASGRDPEIAGGPGAVPGPLFISGRAPDDVSVNRDSLAFSVFAGVVLGAATGAFLASFVSIVGGVLVIWNAFDGGTPDGFRWMIVPISAGILFGGAVGGAIGLLRARGKERRSAARPTDVPARPDVP